MFKITVSWHLDEALDQELTLSTVSLGQPEQINFLMRAVSKLAHTLFPGKYLLQQ